MDSTLADPRSRLAALRELIAQGWWPYTADPGTAGLHRIGEPKMGAPLILEGNSRHALGRLQRALQASGGRVFLLDTGGLDLYRALRAGKLSQELLLDALPPGEADGGSEHPPGTETQPEEDGAVPVPFMRARALLPYPLWHALGGEALQAAGIAAGPASTTSLPAFLQGGALDASMRERRLALRERLHLALAHAGLLLLIALGPSLFVGWQTLLVLTGLVLLTTCLLALLLPILQRRLRRYSQYRPWLTVLLLALLFGLAAGVAAMMGVVPSVAPGLVALATAGAAGWLGALMKPDLTD